MDRFSKFDDVFAYSEEHVKPKIIPVEDGDTKFEQFKNVVTMRYKTFVESKIRAIQEEVYEELQKAVKEAGLKYRIKIKDTESLVSAVLPNINIKLSLDIFPVAFEYGRPAE